MSFPSLTLVDPERLAVCPSVTALSLFIDTTSHHDIASLHLHRIFPNVQVVLLRHFSMSCRECRYYLSDEEVEDGTADLDLVDTCTEKARKAFKAFTKLQKLCTNLGPSPILMALHEAEYDWEAL